MDDDAGYTVDELAQRVGTTVRNVRMYQERGLLPPPRREGRKGVYTADHLRRLRLVMTMLKRGYPLTAIRELVEAWEERRSLGDVLGFEEALAAPYAVEQPTRVSLEDLAAGFPHGGPELLARAIALGIVVPDTDGFVVPSPSLFDAGLQLMADGVPAEAVLDNAAAIFEATDELAGRFVALFVEHVWTPFVEAGMPPDQLRRITEVLERQRPLATRAVVAALAQAMRRHSDAAAVAATGQVWPVATPTGPTAAPPTGQAAVR